MQTHLRAFLFPFLILLLIGIWVVTAHPHGFFVIWLNEHHTSTSDFIFKYWTYLGDGLAVASVIIIIFFVKKRHAYVLGLLGLVLAGVSAFLKQIVFGKVPRPAKYFEGNEALNFVEGVKMHHWYSFPSGHTMTAFVLAFFLVLTIRSTYWSLLFLLVACLVGMSRMYLNQHFLIDVLAGASVGIVLAWIIYKIFGQYLEKDFSSFNQKD